MGLGFALDAAVDVVDRFFLVGGANVLKERRPGIPGAGECFGPSEVPNRAENLTPCGGHH